MRILILHSRYRSGSVSGENRVVEDEARVLRDGGHVVDVYAPSIDATGSTDLIRAAASTVWSAPAVRQVRERVARIRPNVVHVHNLFPALSPAVLRAIPEGTGCVLTLHNYRQLCLSGTFLRDGRVCEDCLGRKPWPGVVHGCYQDSAAASAVLAGSLQLHQAIGSFRRVDLFVAISRFVRDKHIEAGAAADRFLVKPHFAWPSRRREGPGDYFLYLGRLSPEKGVGTLLDAWRGLDARALIVGDGPDAAVLRASAPRNVEFRDPVEPDQVSELLMHARALVVPSLSHEGAGRVVLEAYAAGVPVLASRAGGLPEVVEDGSTGLLLGHGEPEAWIEGVRQLLDDPVSERMGDAGWALWSARYGPSQGLADLEAAYRSALVRARS